MLTVLRALEFPVVESLGWALVHFVWQGLVIAGLVAVILPALRETSAHRRYIVLCGALSLMALCPITTWFVDYSWRGRPDESFEGGFAESPHAPRLPSLEDQESRLAGPIPLLSPTEKVKPFLSEPPEPSTAPISAPIVVASAEPNVAQAKPIVPRFRQTIEAAMPWLIIGWLCGVLLLSIRLLLGWLAVLRLRKVSTRPATGMWQERLRLIAVRLGIQTPIQLVESTLVKVPTVIGWLRPMILLPTSAITGLDVFQLEALIAHELAHIRRHDFLINLIQTSLETLLFYHPGVWWLSHRIREEREHCCDDLAVELCGNRVTYVRALASMEELRSASHLTMAADGGSLIVRIRRLLETPADVRPKCCGASVIAVAILASLGLVTYFSSPSRAATENLESGPKTESASQPASPTDAQKSAIDRPGAQPNTTSGALPAEAHLSPKEIAERIRQRMKKYDAVVYSAETSEVRDSNAFKPMSEPLIVPGRGRIFYRSDSIRWSAHESNFTTSPSQKDPIPRDVVSGYDGNTHFVIEDGRVTLGLNDLSHLRLAPRMIFWHGAMSSDRLLNALESRYAKVVRSENQNGHAWVTVESEPGQPKPGEPRLPENERPRWQFRMTISTDQSCLPVKSEITLNGQPYATETLTDLTQTEEGEWYPKHITYQNHQRLDTLLRREIRIEEFKLAPDVNDLQFRELNPIPTGMDLVDYRSGRIWHNDPWWPEISAWLRINSDWPRGNLDSLDNLRSFADPELNGKPAPPIQAADWFAENQKPPANLITTRDANRFWNWPERKVTVLFFYGGDAISPTPAWLGGLNVLQERYGSLGLDIVCVAANTTERQIAQRALRSMGVKFAVAFDSPAGPAWKGSTPNPYGATFNAYGLSAYAGAVVIDPQGVIRQIPEVSNEKSVSPLESLVRQELEKLDAVALKKSDRRIVAQRVAFDVTGSRLSDDTLEQAIQSESATWELDLARKLETAASPAQREWLTRHRLALDDIVREVIQNPYQLSSASYHRISDEWKRRRAEKAGTVSFSLEILMTEGARDRFETADPRTQSVRGARVHVKAVPLMRLMGSARAPSWMVIPDHASAIETDTDADGRGALRGLRKGTYELTVTSAGMATLERTITIPEDDSKLGMGLTIHQGDSISGTITDSQNVPIPNAKITPRFRHTKPDAPRVTTTSHLPNNAVTTNKQGQFQFENLFDGAYTFEVTAEGYQPKTMERVPAGTMAQLVVLFKLGETPQPVARVAQPVQVHLTGGTKKLPLNGIQVTVRRDLERTEKGSPQSTSEVIAKVKTNEKGIAQFDSVPGRLILEVSADSERPYLPLRPPRGFVLTAKPQGEGPTILNLNLQDACELTLIAIDVATGKGIPGVKFGMENAPGEYWLQVVVPECLGASRPVRDFSDNNTTKLPNEQEYESDAEGKYKILTGPQPGWKYMLYSIPKGYEAVPQFQEVEIETPPGGRVTHTFKLRKKPFTAAAGQDRGRPSVPAEQPSSAKTPASEGKPAAATVDKGETPNIPAQDAPVEETASKPVTQNSTRAEVQTTEKPQMAVPLEFRISVASQPPTGAKARWFALAQPKPPNKRPNPDMGLELTRQNRGEIEALLWDSSDHALLWDDKWSISKCEVVPDPNSTTLYSIGLTLDTNGGEAFRKLTKDHRNQRLAIVLYGKIILAPIIRDEIGASIALTGNFSRAEAEKLAVDLRESAKSKTAGQTETGKQQPKADSREQQNTNENGSQQNPQTAIERGIKFLMSQQRDDGSWPGSNLQPGSITPLVTAALLQAGVDSKHPAIQKAISILRKDEPKFIYTVALHTIVFCAASPREDAELIQRHVRWIENAQVQEGDGKGGWSYDGFPKTRADGSCSRFAILGLDAAQKAGFKTAQRTWVLASQYWLTTQQSTGLWGYTHAAPPSRNMTLAGIGCLATANQYLPVDDQAAVRSAAIVRASNQVAMELKGPARSSHPYYGLHCLERAGNLTRVALFGEVDWKDLVVKRLQTSQRTDGGWPTDKGDMGSGSAEDQFVATSFALMTLAGVPPVPAD